MKLICKKDYENFIKNEIYDIIIGDNYDLTFINSKNEKYPCILYKEITNKYFYTLDEIRILKMKKIL